MQDLTYGMWRTFMELCVGENSMAFEVITFQKEALNRLSLVPKVTKEAS